MCFMFVFEGWVEGFSWYEICEFLGFDFVVYELLEKKIW